MSRFSATIVGAGSVGLGIAASLALAGQRVTLLARTDRVGPLRDADITVGGLLGDHRIPAGVVEIGDAAAPPDGARSCDMLVVTTKAHDVAEAVMPFVGSAARPTAVLSMQNGLGASERLRGVLGDGVPVYASAMMIGMERQGLAHVEVKAAASPLMTGSLLGDPLGPLEAFVAASEGGFVAVKVDPAIRETLYFKLLFNTCMNPTGALTGFTYGELVSNPDTRALIARLADETLAVFDADCGYRPAPDGTRYLQDMLAPAVLARSSGHRSSMVQDMDAGRRTEIDTLNGAVAAMGARLGIATPTHDAIISLIRARSGA